MRIKTLKNKNINFTLIRLITEENNILIYNGMKKFDLPKAFTVQTITKLLPVCHRTLHNITIFLTIKHKRNQQVVIMKPQP